MSVSAHAVPIAVYATQTKNDAKQRDMTTGTAEDRWIQIALLPGAFILFVGGLNMAQDLGWSVYTGVQTTLHFHYCWFIAAIVGTLLAAMCVSFLRKRIFIRFSGLLVTIAGIVNTSAPTNYAALVAARYLNGFAVGFTIVPFIVYASEIATRKCRGSYLALEQFSVCVGIAVQMIYASQWTTYTEFNANRLHGIFVLLAGLLALGVSFAIVESPIFYIRNNQESHALVCQQRIMRVAQLNDATRFVFEDNKNYVLENENRTHAECWAEGALPALKLLVYRVAVAFSFSLPLSRALQVSMLISLGNGQTWPAIIFGILRILTAFAAIFLLDTIGRKLIALLALLVMAALSIGVGGIFSQNYNLLNDYEMAIACTLLLIQQIFAGLFVPSTSTYLGEAFPMRIKPHLIAICIGVEYLIQIIVICTYTDSANGIYAYLVAVGVLNLIFFIFFAFLMPETRNTSLREAQDRFRRFFNTKFY